MPEILGKISASQDVIYPRYDPAAFVGRQWLVEQVARFRDSQDGRQLVIVGEPGSGKSAFVAYLAETWNCPRHFIRADLIRGVTGVSPRAFLVSIGEQLYQKYGPDIFPRAGNQRINLAVGRLEDRSEVVGMFIDELYALPFLSQPQRDIQVQVDVVAGQSRVTGERVRKLVDVTLALDEPTLLHVAVLQPLQEIKRLYPLETVVILIDALDESLQHPAPRIADVLPSASDAGFPSNLRLVMTSRRGDHLLRFSPQDLLYLDDKEKGYWQASRGDTRIYILEQLKRPPLAGILASWPAEEKETYIAILLDSSDGNFLFLYHFFNALAEAAARGETDPKKIHIPKGLDEIYRYFAVEKIREGISASVQFTAAGQISEEVISEWRSLPGVKQVQVAGQEVALDVEDVNQVLGPLYGLPAASGVQITNLHIQQGAGGGAWEKHYLPLLGVLAVALEALSREQLAGFAGVEVVYVDRVVAQLKQFLDVLSDEQGNRYRIYHPSFSEYLLDSSRNRDYPLDGPAYHSQVASYYRGAQARWSEVDWDNVQDLYPFRHLARHLAAARRNQELYALIDRFWMDAQMKRFSSPRAFSVDVELAIDAAGAENPVNLVEVGRGSLIYATLGSLATDVPPESLAILACTGQGKIALDRASLIQDKRQRSRAYCMIAEALFSQNEAGHKDAVEALEQALAAASSISDSHDQAQALADVAGALAQAGETRRAAELANQALQIARAIPDNEARILSLAEVAGALVQIDDRAQALAILDELLAGAKLWTLPNVGVGNIRMVGANAELLAQAASLFAVAGEGQRAAEIAGEARKATHTLWKMIDPAGAVRALCQVASASARLGDFAQATQALDEAYGLAGGIQGQERVIALLGVARAWVQSGEAKRALEATELALAEAQNILHRSMRMEVLGETAAILMQAGEAARAAQIAGDTLNASLEVEDVRAKATALSYLAQALADAGVVEGAAEVAGRTLALAHDLSDDSMRAWVWSQVANTLAQAGMVDQAMIMPGALQEERDAAWLLVEIGQAQIQRGEAARGAATAGEACRAAEHIQDIQTRAEALSNAARVMALAGEGERSSQAFDRAIEAARAVQGDLERVQSLAGVAGVLARAGETARAVKVAGEALPVAEAISDPNQQAQALYQVARALAQAGDYDQALSLAQRIQLYDPQLWTLVELARVMLQAGEFERVQALLGDTDLGNPENWPMSAAVRVEIALSHARQGHAESAVETARAVHPNQKTVTLSQVSILLAQAGEFEWAIWAADEIEVPGWKASTFSEVVQSLARAGELQQAVQVAQKMTHEGWRALALGYLAVQMAKIGDRARAIDLAGQILAMTRRSADNPLKAATLCRLVQAASCLGDVDQVRALARDAFAAARRAGRDQVFQVVQECAGALACLDNGQTLWAVYQALVASEDWWITPSNRSNFG